MKALPYILDYRCSIISEKIIEVFLSEVIVIIQNDIKLDTYKKTATKQLFTKRDFKINVTGEFRMK